MLLDPVGIEPATWSLDGRTSDWATEVSFCSCKDVIKPSLLFSIFWVLFVSKGFLFPEYIRLYICYMYNIIK